MTTTETEVYRTRFFHTCTAQNKHLYGSRAVQVWKKGTFWQEQRLHGWHIRMHRKARNRKASK